MEWIITSRSSRAQLGTRTFETRELAEAWIARLGSVLAENYTPWCAHPDQHVSNMINEGLVKNDLESILMPRVLVDEYVPSDPKSDNVVCAFLIRSVPEAVQPMKSFLMHCNGVLSVDFGDSETIPDCSVLYVEFDRENLNIADINDMMTLVGMLAGLKPSEFTMSFPNTDKKFPYSPQTLKKYFAMRSRKANALAQKQAIISRTKELQDEIEKEVKKAGKNAPQQGQQDTNQPDGPDQTDIDQQDQEEDQQEQAAEAPSDNTPADAGNPVASAQKAVGESLVNSLVGLFG